MRPAISLRLVFSALALLLAITATTVDARAEEARQPISLTIVIDSADFYPYYYRDNGKLVGPVPEITAHVLSSMGYVVDFHEVPWARAIDLVKRRQVDAISGIFHRSEREDYLVYPEHYPASSLLSLMVPASSGFDFSGDFASLEGQDIGAVLGWSYGLFREPVKIGRIDFDDEGMLVRNVASGRIDMAVGNPSSLEKFAVEMGLLDRVRMLAPPVEVTPLYTAFTKRPGHDSLARSFSQALAQFKSSPVYQEIMQKHGLGGAR